MHPQPRQGGNRCPGARKGWKKTDQTPPLAHPVTLPRSLAFDLAGGREARTHASANPPCTTSCSLLEGVVERIILAARKSALLTAGREGYFGWRRRLGGKARCVGRSRCRSFGGEGWMEGRGGGRWNREGRWGGGSPLPSPWTVPGASTTDECQSRYQPDISATTRRK